MEIDKSDDVNRSFEDLDIYGDIHDFDLGLEVEKLRTENKRLEERVCSFETEIRQLNGKIDEMKAVQSNLTNNISSLLKTAKAEIDRKNRIIAELREEVDNKYINKSISVPSKRKIIQTESSSTNDSKRFKCDDTEKSVNLDACRNQPEAPKQRNSKFNENTDRSESSTRQISKSRNVNDEFHDHYKQSKSRYGDSENERCNAKSKYTPTSNHSHDRYSDYDRSSSVSYDKNKDDRHYSRSSHSNKFDESIRGRHSDNYKSDHKYNSDKHSDRHEKRVEKNDRYHSKNSRDIKSIYSGSSRRTDDEKKLLPRTHLKSFETSSESKYGENLPWKSENVFNDLQKLDSTKTPSKPPKKRLKILAEAERKRDQSRLSQIAKDLSTPVTNCKAFSFKKDHESVLLLQNNNLNSNKNVQENNCKQSERLMKSLPENVKIDNIQDSQTSETKKSPTNTVVKKIIPQETNIETNVSIISSDVSKETNSSAKSVTTNQHLQSEQSSEKKTKLSFGEYMHKKVPNTNQLIEESKYSKDKSSSKICDEQNQTKVVKSETRISIESENLKNHEQSNINETNNSLDLLVNASILEYCRIQIEKDKATENAQKGNAEVQNNCTEISVKDTNKTQSRKEENKCNSVVVAKDAIRGISPKGREKTDSSKEELVCDIKDDSPKTKLKCKNSTNVYKSKKKLCLVLKRLTEAKSIDPNMKDGKPSSNWTNSSEGTNKPDDTSRNDSSSIHNTLQQEMVEANLSNTEPSTTSKATVNTKSNKTSTSEKKFDNLGKLIQETTSLESKGTSEEINSKNLIPQDENKDNVNAEPTNRNKKSEHCKVEELGNETIINQKIDNEVQDQDFEENSPSNNAPKSTTRSELVLDGLLDVDVATNKTQRKSVCDTSELIISKPPKAVTDASADNPSKKEPEEKKYSENVTLFLHDETFVDINPKTIKPNTEDKHEHVIDKRLVISVNKLSQEQIKYSKKRTKYKSRSVGSCKDNEASKIGRHGKMANKHTKRYSSESNDGTCRPQLPKQKKRSSGNADVNNSSSETSKIDVRLEENRIIKSIKEQMEKNSKWDENVAEIIEKVDDSFKNVGTEDTSNNKTARSTKMVSNCEEKKTRSLDTDEDKPKRNIVTVANKVKDTSSENIDVIETGKSLTDCEDKRVTRSSRRQSVENGKKKTDTETFETANPKKNQNSYTESIRNENEESVLQNDRSSPESEIRKSYNSTGQRNSKIMELFGSDAESSEDDTSTETVVLEDTKTIDKQPVSNINNKGKVCNAVENENKTEQCVASSSKQETQQLCRKATKRRCITTSSGDRTKKRVTGNKCIAKSCQDKNKTDEESLTSMENISKRETVNKPNLKQINSRNRLNEIKRKIQFSKEDTVSKINETQEKQLLINNSVSKITENANEKLQLLNIKTSSNSFDSVNNDKHTDTESNSNISDPSSVDTVINCKPCKTSTPRKKFENSLQNTNEKKMFGNKLALEKNKNQKLAVAEQLILNCPTVSTSDKPPGNLSESQSYFDKQQSKGRKRITPTPVKDDKQLCSFENILTKNSGSSPFGANAPSPLHLTHDGEIPVLHLEENQINNLPTETTINDRNILSLLDTMNISNMECDASKFKIVSRNLEGNEDDKKTNGLTFENIIKKATSPVVISKEETKVSNSKELVDSNCAVAGGSNLEQTLQPNTISTVAPQRRRRRCRLIIKD